MASLAVSRAHYTAFAVQIPPRALPETLPGVDGMKRWLGFARSLLIYHNPATLRAWRRFYREILRPGDVVIDVGAHVGTRARAMRAAGAQVVALEPQALFARFLRLTLPSDIVLIQAAAGSAEALADMAVSSRHPTVSSLQTSFVDDAAMAPGFEHVRWDRRERVQVTTLDLLIAQHGRPAYIKIDVEGFELEVLSGLSQPVPLVSVEYLPAFAALTHQVITRLEALGTYRFNPVVGERSGFLWLDWRSGAAARQWLDGLDTTASSGDLFARLSNDD
ncbi:MAG: FkbM family methyltransferase [Glaciecola sp.]|jgi:FkbM family methyltransferase